MNTRISKKRKIIAFKDFRLNAPKYIADLEKGQSFLVMKRSKPIFQMEPVDEWGETGWETLIDFRKFTKDGKGMPVDKVLKIFKELKKKNG
jgi:antitoxin (DNA-binding transcriptional repressor) of toxin-antitoxin stability system